MKGHLKFQIMKIRSKLSHYRKKSILDSLEKIFAPFPLLLCCIAPVCSIRRSALELHNGVTDLGFLGIQPNWK